MAHARRALIAKEVQIQDPDRKEGKKKSEIHIKYSITRDYYIY